MALANLLLTLGLILCVVMAYCPTQSRHSVHQESWQTLCLAAALLAAPANLVSVLLPTATWFSLMVLGCALLALCVEAVMWRRWQKLKPPNLAASANQPNLLVLGTDVAEINRSAGKTIAEFAARGHVGYALIFGPQNSLQATNCRRTLFANLPRRSTEAAEIHLKHVINAQLTQLKPDIVFLPEPVNHVCAAINQAFVKTNENISITHYPHLGDDSLDNEATIPLRLTNLTSA